MNYIDIALSVPLLWGLYQGFVKGLIVSAASAVALGLGVWGGIHFSGYCADKIKELFGWQSNYLPIVSFATVFLIIVIGVYFIAKLIANLAKGLSLGGFDKIAGALFGALKFAVLLSVIIFIIDSIEKSYPIFSLKVKNESVLYKPIGKVAPILIPALSGK